MFKLRTPLTAILILFLIQTAFAQQQPTDAPTREDVLRFMEVLHLREQMEKTLQGIVQVVTKDAHESFRRDLPNATPAQLARMDKLLEELFAEYKVDELLDAVVPIYQKHFSKSDLDAVLVFYMSPPGQRMLQEMPALMTESMQAGMAIGRKKAESMQGKVKAAIEDMKRESEQPKNQ